MGLTNLGTYNPASRLPGGGLSDHARYPARAFDVGGPPATLDRFFRAMINRPGVEYVIYRDKIWSRSRGLHAYTSGGHETHVHVSGSASARGTTPAPPVQSSGGGGIDWRKRVGAGILLGPAGVPLVGGTTLHEISGLPGSGIAGGIADAYGSITSVGDALGWASKNWDRMLEVAAGFILVLVGLVLLGRSMGLGNLGKKTPMGRAASFASGGAADPIEAAYAQGEADWLRQEARRAGKRDAMRRSPSSQTSEIPY